MDKVVLYGVGGTFLGLEKIFQELQIKQKVKVIGVADRNLKGGERFHGFKILSLDEIAETNMDCIIITAQKKVAGEIFADLSDAGIRSEKIFWVYNYPPIKEELECIKRTQLDVIRKILSASDEEIMDFEWMRSIVGQYGIFPYSEEDVDGTGNVEGTISGMIQRPNEFAEYCVYLSKWHIETAIEVGVFHGKSSYFMCALLARRNPDLVYELVDIADNLDNYEKFHELLPQMRKRIPSTSDDYVGQAYDFVFIDADHSYDASMRDYMNLGQYAKKLTVFHDIYAHEYDHLNGGTVRMWNEVVDMTPQHKHHVFSEYPNQWMGIGVLEHVR